LIHSPHSSHAAALSAGASPSASSPTGTNSLTKIVVAQVYLLLSTIKEDKDRAKWELQVDQLKKLIDEHGMEVFSKYFTRLVAGNAPQIFPGLHRPVANPGNYHILVEEMRKVARDVDQATKIAESVETGTEDIFRDFDLSTFMEHFKLDALEKTILALAFKLGNRSDLKTKADAILSTNFSTFMDILSRPENDAHPSLSPHFVAVIVDRFLQYHPPNFNASSRRDLQNYVVKRYLAMDQAPPSEVLTALDLTRVLADRPGNALARHIQRTGPDFTRDEDSCVSYLQALQGRPNNLQLGPEQVSSALTFTTISEAQSYDPRVLVASLRRLLPQTFNWTDVVLFFDQPSARISSPQFLRLYQALLPIAQDASNNFDIQRLWGGAWNEPEAQLSFVTAYGSLTPEQLDATTIPGLHRSITLEEYAKSSPQIQERAAVAIKHPLVSVAALSSIFSVALSSVNASTSVEAKRLFQEVVVPNLDIFLVSAFEIPRQSWAPMAIDTLNSLFENFLHRVSPHHEFVLDSLWRKDKEWVTQRLIDAHAVRPMDLTLVFEHAVQHHWLDELVYLPNGFGIDLAALAHAEGYLDLSNWGRINAERSNEMSRTLLQFLMIKANLEIMFQRPPEGQAQVKNSTTLQVRTVSALLQILEDFLPLPKSPMPDLILVQRQCITAYPRLINYGEGYDDVIDANGKDGNALPQAANNKMEEHYRRMYGDELQVRNIVEILDSYKHSRDPLDQDVFACMIHGLFDEYNHYVDYPLEALATTAVLFGGIISHKLISDLPLKIGLGMILEAVRDHMPDDPMYKFGLQALMQLFVRFREWPGFCEQLLRIPGLQGTDAFKKAEEVVRDHEEEVARGRNGAEAPQGMVFGADQFPNGNAEDSVSNDRQAPAFTAIFAESISPDSGFQDPGEEAQDRIQFALNNITESTIQQMRNELREVIEHRNQQWFASHLVEERAKMQPNYHHVYLDLIKLFEDASLWTEVLRETYVSVIRMLNSEGTMTNSTDRTHLKNLGGWLGLLTLARDRPIKHRNIAFKQLLMEAHDTKRLIVVIPFVCKVLIQGANSAVFRPPNPWLMDIIHLLIDLYHHAELKLNLKFEIEVLCKGLNLDHKSIEPSGEILNRPALEEAAEVLQHDQLDTFENLSLNGLGPAVTSGLQAQTVAPTIPDLGPLITIPPANEMVVSTNRLHEIVLTALTRALQDIIQPVVDRSVTIAAISTIQMIRKDFVTEGDENRLRTSAINMVKATAGSLALVTSKEPLRANFTNYMRNLSNDLPSGLPEGTIIMCVNSNIDLACNVIEKQAEERAIPEIEEMIERDMENRRRHRANRPDEPYYDSNASRWSMTIPAPYKLSPNANGLNPEQMAIYEEFGRQPRTSATTATSHAPSTSDATRSLANEVLQEQYSNIPSLPTPAETPSVQHLSGQLQAYPPVHSGVGNNVANGRAPNFHMEMRVLMERINKLLQELRRVTGEAHVEHFKLLPRPHPVLDVVDALVQLIIKASQNSEEFVLYAVEQICGVVFAPPQESEDTLMLESMVHVIETVRSISGHMVTARVRSIVHQQQPNAFLNLPLLAALITTDLLDWSVVDQALSRALEARKERSLDFFEHVIDLALLNRRPIALFNDFVRSLEAAWVWISEDPSLAQGQRLKQKLVGSGPPSEAMGVDDNEALRRDQMEYVFDEWVRLCNNYNASDKAPTLFVQQLRVKQVIRDRDDFCLFLRIAIDISVERFEQSLHNNIPDDAYVVVDALATLVSIFINVYKPEGSRSEFLDSVLALITLVLNHHQVKRGELLNQRVFFRLLSMLLHQVLAVMENVSDEERKEMLLTFATRFAALGPLRMPSFTFGWLSLIQHRAFLPALLQLQDNEGWASFSNLLCQLLDCLGEHIKTINIPPPAKELYRSVFKFLVVLQHDFPEFIAAHHMKLCASIPSHCAQLMNTVLAANPQQSFNKSGDRSEELRALAAAAEDAVTVLDEHGLLGMIDQAIQNGPSEDVVAQIAHSLMQSTGNDTVYGHRQVMVDVRLAGAVVMQLGRRGAERAQRAGPPIAVTGREPEVGMLSLLVHELPVVARYYVLASLVNNLRFPNPQTEFFSQVLLYIFGKDLDDPEETEIRQDITRILLERLSGFWPQPWGLMVTVIELLKNEKYMFFELPFIKADPEVTDRFLSILSRT